MVELEPKRARACASHFAHESARCGGTRVSAEADVVMGSKQQSMMAMTHGERLVMTSERLVGELPMASNRGPYESKCEQNERGRFGNCHSRPHAVEAYRLISQMKSIPRSQFGLQTLTLEPPRPVEPRRLEKIRSEREETLPSDDAWPPQGSA
jgi:hypothetical protein